MKVTVRPSTYLPTAPTLLSVRLPPRPGYNRYQHKQDTIASAYNATATVELFVPAVRAHQAGGVAAHTAHVSTLRYYPYAPNRCPEEQLARFSGTALSPAISYALDPLLGPTKYHASCIMTRGDLQRFFLQYLKHFADDEGSARSSSSSPHQ